MKAYSLDLRKKIIETYLNQKSSIRQLAIRFQVAKSFVQKLIKRYIDIALRRYVLAVFEVRINTIPLVIYSVIVSLILP